MGFGRRFGAIAVAATVAAQALGLAGARAESSAEVLLHVRDAAGEEHGFTRADLDALPQVTFSTGTIWTGGVIAFSGPPLRRVLAESGITGGKVRLIALNDYMVELDLGRIGADFPIVATRMDGRTFGVRDNGPLWVMYPFDTDMSYQDETSYAASVWQFIAAEAVAP